MALEDPETARLAEQRVDDLDSIEARRRADRLMLAEQERARAIEQGRREGLEAAHTAEQDRHLAAINGSIEDFRRELVGISKQLTNLDKVVSGIVLVTDALERKGVSTRTFVVGVLALLVPIAILVITLAVTGGR